MKKYIPLLLFLFSFIWVGAQDFGSIGTEWAHCIYPFTQEPNRDSIIVKSVSVQTKYGLSCNTLQVTHRNYNFTTSDSILICNDGEQVYYEELDSLYLLYDFSLVAGDSMIVKYPTVFDTTFLYHFPNANIYTTLHIDSTRIEMIDGVPLKKLFFDYPAIPLIQFGNYAIERIGFRHWIFPYFEHPLAEQNGIVGLSNFVDNDISFSTGICYISDTEDLNRKNQVKIYPNPSRSNVHISTTGGAIQSLSVFSLTGKKLITQDHIQASDIMLDTRNLAPGIYFLNIALNDRTLVQKLIIQ